ncbi:hypothetical protein [Egicoccus sp. AB-alg6-2]|uniref:hypothetical protein n=1 Tax=Egicoccus sp. AB-alg6-2 TaxID=3242692 RepID=UPI00359DDB30
MKLQRAHFLLSELREAMNGFFRERPYTLEAAEAPNGDLVTRVRVSAEPPLEWSALAGDIVHNLRSALDHVAWALVAEEGQPDEWTCFPITDKERSFGDRARKALRGAPEARQMVRGLSPWRDGNEDLWLLHRLNIVDKHRLLLVVGSASTGIGLRMTFRGFEEGDSPITMDPIVLQPKNIEVPVLDEAVVFRVLAEARKQPADSHFRTDHDVRFDIVFGLDTPAPAAPVGPLLERLLDATEKAIQHLMPRL